MNSVLFLTTVPAGRVFALDQQTLINIGIQFFNAGFLAVVLGFLLYKPLQEFMNRRTQKISDQLKDAQEKLTEAEALKTQYEKKLRNIQTERFQILDAARITASERSKHLLEEARQEAAVIRKRAEENISTEKERLKKETKSHIIEISSLMAAKFVTHQMDQDTQNRLFEETMAELEEARWLS